MIFETVRMIGLNALQFLVEDNRLFVSVGIDQLNDAACLAARLF